MHEALDFAIGEYYKDVKKGIPESVARENFFVMIKQDFTSEFNNLIESRKMAEYIKLLGPEQTV